MESKNKEGENEERGFDLIMKDKERLLSQSCPIRFIFSHSALKEGWDNPNVFQICTLKDTSNEIKKRQEVGRGMRLCVNDKGERQDADVLGDHVFDTNILTVIASESYDDFAKKLQTDMAEACASRPVVVTATLFADQLAQTQDGHSIKITTEQAVEIHEELIVQGYIKKGKLTQKYFDEKKADSLQFGEVENLHSFIIKQLDKVFNPDAIVIVHLDNGWDNGLFNWFFDELKKNGGKWDMIGMSLYPYWSRDAKPEYTAADAVITDCIKNIKAVSAKYNCDVMVVETGMECADDKGNLASASVLAEGKRQLARILKECKENTGGRCKGVFYWEPECRPNQYRLGAFTEDGRPTVIMDAFK